MAAGAQELTWEMVELGAAAEPALNSLVQRVRRPAGARRRPPRQAPRAPSSGLSGRGSWQALASLIRLHMCAGH
jgi:hypothetical protein